MCPSPIGLIAEPGTEGFVCALERGARSSATVSRHSALLIGKIAGEVVFERLGLQDAALI